MNWYQLSPDEVIAQLDSSSAGLSEGEAAARLGSIGPNQLPKPIPISRWRLFFRQFQSFIIYILLVAVAFSMVLGEWVDAGVILSILLINAVIGYVQELNAQRSIHALREMDVPQARVFRDRDLVSLPSVQLVPGDVVYLESGDRVPADLRLLEAARVRATESALTGESLPVHKQADALEGTLPLGDQTNMLFASTSLSEGSATGMVVNTAQCTEIGKIAALVTEAEGQLTPLQVKLERFGKRLSWGVLGICVVIILIMGTMAYLAEGFQLKHFLDILLVVVALAVAAVPEGLPAVVTISLSIGVKRLLRRNALVRRLSSVETLGSCDVICTDKTGTLTQNNMEVTHAWTPEGEVDLGANTSTSGLSAQLFRTGVICNHASLFEKDGEWKSSGDPTEIALLMSGRDAGLLDNLPEVVEEWPFDADRKCMSVMVQEENRHIQYTKGAPSAMLELCSHYAIGDKREEMTDAMRQLIEEQVQSFSRQALRVLAFARDTKEGGIEEIGLTFLGLQAMQDPPRLDAAQSIELAKQAGIRVIMITGDYHDTALAIGKAIGIAGNACNGSELEDMSDKELEQRLADDTNFFTRVAPVHKQRIVAALQRQGHVVAMTGDGVNDAPAIKEADIGIAVGSGTDVAKEAADFVLIDNAFSTIVAAIEEGRGIYTNIQKAIILLLSGNLAEVLTVLGAVLIGLPLPFTAVMLLWINLISDGAPALALSVDPFPKGLMAQKPLPKQAGLLPVAQFTFLTALAIVTSGLGLWVFWESLPQGKTIAQTQAFNFLVFAEFIIALLIRAWYGVPLFSNKWLWGAILISLLLQVVLVLTPAGSLFGLANVDQLSWRPMLWALGGLVLFGVTWILVKSLHKAL